MKNIINKLMKFLDASHSEFNAAQNIKEILLGRDFIELNEKDKFELSPDKNYFLLRNDNSVIAFKFPKTYISKMGFNICASHLDSPTLKLKMGKESINNGYHRVNVEVYGGTILSSWLDRPLSVAGRAIVKVDNQLVTKFIDIKSPILIIPNVCIHFNREINKGFAYNPEVDMKPVVSLGNEENSILEAISKELNVSKDLIIAYDLETYNYTNSMIGGLNKELLMSQRIDNLESAFLSLEAFINNDCGSGISVYASFNSEEIGSRTLSGADSDFLKSVLIRIYDSLGYTNAQFLQTLANSFMLSVDNGHAVHPNHPEYSDPQNLVYLNKGPIIKFNSNMAYLSDAASSAKIIDLCKINNIPYQVFYNKSDVRGGSTLGTLSVSHLGIQTCDIGLPQLAMHSSYETAGANDIEPMCKLIEAFYSME